MSRKKKKVEAEAVAEAPAEPEAAAEGAAAGEEVKEEAPDENDISLRHNSMHKVLERHRSMRTVVQLIEQELVDRVELQRQYHVGFQAIARQCVRRVHLDANEYECAVKRQAVCDRMVRDPVFASSMISATVHEGSGIRDAPSAPRNSMARKSWEPSRWHTRGSGSGAREVSGRLPYGPPAPKPSPVRRNCSERSEESATVPTIPHEHSRGDPVASPSPHVPSRGDDTAAGGVDAAVTFRDLDEVHRGGEAQAETIQSDTQRHHHTEVYVNSLPKQRIRDANLRRMSHDLGHKYHQVAKFAAAERRRAEAASRRDTLLAKQSERVQRRCSQFQPALAHREAERYLHERARDADLVNRHERQSARVRHRELKQLALNQATRRMNEDICAYLSYCRDLHRKTEKLLLQQADGERVRNTQHDAEEALAIKSAMRERAAEEVRQRSEYRELMDRWVVEQHQRDSRKRMLAETSRAASATAYWEAEWHPSRQQNCGGESPPTRMPPKGTGSTVEDQAYHRFCGSRERVVLDIIKADREASASQSPWRQRAHHGSVGEAEASGAGPHHGGNPAAGAEGSPLVSYGAESRALFRPPKPIWH